MVKVEDKVTETPGKKTETKEVVDKVVTDVAPLSDTDKRLQLIERQRKELDDRIAEYQNKEVQYQRIDNKRFFNKGGTLNKLISLVAAGFGGYASGRYGGPNVYLDLIDKEVKSDIAQQKLDRADEVAKQNAAYKKIQQLADRYKLSVDNDIAYKKLDMLQKELDAKITTNHQKLSKEQSTLKSAEIMRRGNIPPAQFAQISFENPKQKYNER